jgi:hypothetical protein
MKENGTWEEVGAKENSLTQREKYMKANGEMIRPTASVFILTLTGQAMSDNGIMTSSKEEELRLGPTVLNSQDSTKMVRRTALESICGQMVPNMKESGSTTKLRDTVIINGAMVENT